MRTAEGSIAYLHLGFIGFGVDRLWGFTGTVFRPGLPTLSGRHLTLAMAFTSFQVISDHLAGEKWFNQPDRKDTLGSPNIIIS